MSDLSIKENQKEKKKKKPKNIAYGELFLGGHNQL